MNVKNRSYIRKLSLRVLKSSTKRNLITIVAIILTTLMFTSLFTIVMSINASYEKYQFKQVGGYAHGAFKEVTKEQIEEIKKHPKIKEACERTVIGTIMDNGFSQTPGEVSYMEGNNNKWSYVEPTSGRLPVSGNEIVMDTKAMELLGIEPVLGSEIELSYELNDNNRQNKKIITDRFILVGYWEYDNFMPVHYINITKDYQDKIIEEAKNNNEGYFRTDLSVMLPSTVNIEKQLEKVKADLGYVDDNNVRIGVNWGYTNTQLSDTFSPETVVVVSCFLLLVIFTGYLIIYNIFQIAVSEDIRFYGLIKTIGVTPKQLKRLIRYQALWLCIAGIPIGLLAGYGVGYVMIPLVIKNTTYGLSVMERSSSPFIFVFATVFAVLTVLLSCEKPGKKAGRVSPIEAVRYTDVVTKKKEKKNRGAKVHQMALANLGRNPKKTILVVVSLSLAVVLLNVLVTFVSGFDMDTFLARGACSDFVVSDVGYFRTTFSGDDISKEQIDEIKSNVSTSLEGCGYTQEGLTTCWMKEDAWYDSVICPKSEVPSLYQTRNKKNGLVEELITVEGLDRELLSKVDVVEGDISRLTAEDEDCIALVVDIDDFGNIKNRKSLPALGDTISMIYKKVEYIDSRTGEPANEDTPYEYYEDKVLYQKDIEYTVCAYVTVHHSMSYRYITFGYRAILPVDKFTKDSGLEIIPMFYMFDTPDSESEEAAEDYLCKLTKNNTAVIQYESKKQTKMEYSNFRGMFLSMGGVLCGIIGLVGALNFFNAIMTGIISRRKELAVLQAVGMTGKQIKQMLVYEGLLYSVGSGVVSMILSLALQPIINNFFENTFWFYKARFVIYPVLLMLPVFVLMGWLIPSILNKRIAKQSVVEALREAE